MYNKPDIEPILAYDLLRKVFPPNPSYIVPRVLTKGGTLLLGGEAKAGKSWLMLEAARALSTGTPFLSDPNLQVPEPVRVLLIDQEIGYEYMQERIAAVFKEDSEDLWRHNFALLSKELDLHLNDTHGFREFARIITKFKPNVLILDPISFLYHKDENSNTDVGQLFYTLGRLKEVGKDQGMSIIFSHHFGKRPWGKAAEGWDALSEYNFRGASKWKDGGDSLITIKRTEELKTPYTAFRLRARFLLRHGSAPPEATYIFNEKNDLRVRHEETFFKALPKIKVERQLPKLPKQDLLELAPAYKHGEDVAPDIVPKELAPMR